MVNIRHKKHHRCVKHKHKYLSLLRVVKRNKSLFATLKCSSLTNVELLFALEEICNRFNSVAIEESSKAIEPNDFNAIEVLSRCWVVLKRIPNNQIKILSTIDINGDSLLSNTLLEVVDGKEHEHSKRQVLRAPRLNHLKNNSNPECISNWKEVRICNSFMPQNISTTPCEEKYHLPSLLNNNAECLNDSEDLQLCGPFGSEEANDTLLSVKIENVQLQPTDLTAVMPASTNEILPSVCDIKYMSPKETPKELLTTNSDANLETTINCSECSINRETTLKLRDCKILNHIPDLNVSEASIAVLKNCSVILNRLPDKCVTNLLNTNLQVESYKYHKPKEYKLRECRVVLYRLTDAVISNASKVNGLITKDKIVVPNTLSLSYKIDQKLDTLEEDIFKDVKTNHLENNVLCEMENDNYFCSVCEYKTLSKNYIGHHVCQCAEDKGVLNDFSVYDSVQKIPFKRRLLNY